MNNNNNLYIQWHTQRASFIKLLELLGSTKFPSLRNYYKLNPNKKKNPSVYNCVSYNKIMLRR